MFTMMNTLNNETNTRRSRAKGNRNEKISYSSTVRTPPNTSPKKQSMKK